MLSTLVGRIGPRLRRPLMLLLALATMGLPLHLLPALAAEPHGVTAPAAVAQTPSVEEILARHYEAIGGDRFQQVQTMKTIGTSVVMGMEEFDGPLVNAGDKGHTVELLEIAQVDGRDAYKLQVTMHTGDVQTHYVDAETYYVTRVESDASDVEIHEYRLFDGHPVPTIIEMMGPYGEQTIHVDDVELGVAIDDNAFRMR